MCRAHDVPSAQSASQGNHRQTRVKLSYAKRLVQRSFSDDLPAIRGRPALFQPRQSEIAVTEFKALESRKI
jgi:hypothetical protein